MLIHEVLKDEVKIRAESLSYLMVFSLLPLIAGGFFLFNVFAQFGYVQDAMQSGIDQLLINIPEEHREILAHYVLQFKDAYWQSLSQKSSSIGVFAIFILIWVGLSTFNNIDSTLNHVWSANRQRPFFEKLRNFLVVMVLAPLVLISTLSIPLILQKVDIGIFLSQQLPLVPFLINMLLFPFLGWLTFILIYRFIPVTQVRWKSAVVGGLFSMAALTLVNYGMRLYFKYGTNSAYGKAAIAPLVLFWMYLIWFVLILGAEVSYLMQTEVEAFEEPETERSVRDGGNLVSLLLELQEGHRQGRGPLSFAEIKALGKWSGARVSRLLSYLMSRSWVARCDGPDGFMGRYVLARDVSEIRIQDVLREFLYADTETSRRFEAPWKESFEYWLQYFEDKTFGTYLAEKTKKKR